MNRLAIMALTVLILAAVISACDDGTWHWITPMPHPTSVAPDMVPEKSLMPTVTPTPAISYPCSRWHVWDRELTFDTGEM